MISPLYLLLCAQPPDFECAWRATALEYAATLQPRSDGRDQPSAHTTAALIAVDLSEPYSIFTYRYFINNWPNLCYNATVKAADAADSEERRVVGTIVCKQDRHRSGSMRGYIAMLAVHHSMRKRGMGRELVKLAVRAMREDGCDEAVLETEVTNTGALRLYEGLGFVRDKRLHRYYLNGNDAYRLKLWFNDGPLHAGPSDALEDPEAPDAPADSAEQSPADIA